MNRYLEYLKGKKVIIVGSARYLMNKNNGEWIDSHDVVTRINNGILILDNKESIKDLGNKTDIVYNYLSDNFFTNKRYTDKLEVNKVKYIVSLYHFSNITGAFRNLLNPNIYHINYDINFFMNVRKSMRLAPQTGTVAILHLLKSELKELNVIGFDYYQSGVYENYNNKTGNEAINVNLNTKDHCIKDQLKCLSEIKDKRLHFDEVLKKLIKNKEVLNG